MLIVAAIGVPCAIYYQLQYNPKHARKLALPIPVEVVKATVSSLTSQIGASGQVLQHNTVNVTSRITSVAEKVLVNIGDIIRVGKPILQAARRVFEAAVTAAQGKVASTRTEVATDEIQLQALQSLRKKGLAAQVEVDKAQIALDEAKASQAEAQENIVNAQLDLDFTQLKSPVNGIVLARFVNPNERFDRNQVLFQLGVLDQVYFLAHVQEETVGNIIVGQDAEVTFPSFPASNFHGTVENVDPRTDPKTRTFTAYITINNPDLKLKPGISGFGRILLQKTVLAVPTVAVMNYLGENPTVFVVNSESRAVLTPVRIGINAGGMTEILAGIKEGDTVVTVGSLYLKNNDKVHMTSPQPK